jgi:hypothetical protein
MRERIIAAIQKAKTYIEEAIKHTKNIQEEANHIWHAASELEYALFLFSIMNEAETEKETWRIDPKTKQIDRKELLKIIQNLIIEGEKNLKANIGLAHKNIWMARGYLLVIQNEIEKTDRKKKMEKEAK